MSPRSSRRSRGPATNRLYDPAPLVMPIQPSWTQAPDPATPATPPVSMIVATSRSVAPARGVANAAANPAPAAAQAIRSRAISPASLMARVAHIASMPSSSVARGSRSARVARSPNVAASRLSRPRSKPIRPWVRPAAARTPPSRSGPLFSSESYASIRRPVGSASFATKDGISSTGAPDAGTAIARSRV